VRIDIVERQPVRLLCWRYTGPYGEAVGRFWRNTVAPVLADYGLIDCPRYGVILDDPKHTAPEACRYDACVQLPAGLSLNDTPETTILGGHYAVTPFKGRGAEIAAAWEALPGVFGRDSAYCPDHMRPPFEHYPRGAFHDARTGVFACELCLPATRRRGPDNLAP
jgi:AraC family transcriptional regulator